MKKTVLTCLLLSSIVTISNAATINSSQALLFPFSDIFSSITGINEFNISKKLDAGPEIVIPVNLPKETILGRNYIESDGHGNIYVSAYENNYIHRFNINSPETTSLTMVPYYLGSDGKYKPFNVNDFSSLQVYAHNNKDYVINRGEINNRDYRIWVYDTSKLQSNSYPMKINSQSDEWIDELVVPPSQVSNAYKVFALTFDKKNNLYVAYNNICVIAKYEPNKHDYSELYYLPNSKEGSACGLVQQLKTYENKDGAVNLYAVIFDYLPTNANSSNDTNERTELLQEQYQAMLQGKTNGTNYYQEIAKLNPGTLGEILDVIGHPDDPNYLVNGFAFDKNGNTYVSWVDYKDNITTYISKYIGIMPEKSKPAEISKGFPHTYFPEILITDKN